MGLNLQQRKSRFFFFTRWKHEFATDLTTVDLQVGRLHEVAEEVRLVLQVRWGEQPQVLHNAVGGLLLVEEMEKLVFLHISLALLHNIHHLHGARECFCHTFIK